MPNELRITVFMNIIIVKEYGNKELIRRKHGY